MIQPYQCEEIRRLLAERTPDGRRAYSQRKVAKLVGVSRGTVGVIAGGRHWSDRPDRHEDPIALPDGPEGRCPGCGAKVQLPCLACQIRQRMAARGLKVFRGNELESPALELGAAEEARRQELEVRQRVLGERGPGDDDFRPAA